MKSIEDNSKLFLIVFKDKSPFHEQFECQIPSLHCANLSVQFHPYTVHDKHINAQTYLDVA